MTIAEGEGRNAVYLAEQGMHVTTWNFAESGLKKTNKLAKARGVVVSTEFIDLKEARWDEEKESSILD